MSVNPSARSRSSAMYQGAEHMLVLLLRRTVVVSGGGSSANAAPVLRNAAAPTAEAAATKARRVGSVRIGVSSPAHTPYTRSRNCSRFFGTDRAAAMMAAAGSLRRTHAVTPRE